MTACTQCSGQSTDWALLCSGQGGSHALSDICQAKIVQQRWGRGVRTIHCRGYGTTFFRGIPLASQCGNTSLGWWRLRIPQRPTHWLFLNISYDQSRVRVMALGRHCPIQMFDVKNVGMISSACVCNGRWGRLLFERPGRNSKKKEGTLYLVVDAKSLSPITILRDVIPWKAFKYEVNCHQIKLRWNSALIFTVTAMSEGVFAPLEGWLCLLWAIIIMLHLFWAQ